MKKIVLKGRGENMKKILTSLLCIYIISKENKIVNYLLCSQYMFFLGSFKPPQWGNADKPQNLFELQIRTLRCIILSQYLFAHTILLSCAKCLFQTRGITIYYVLTLLKEIQIHLWPHLFHQCTALKCIVFHILFQKFLQLNLLVYF